MTTTTSEVTPSKVYKVYASALPSIRMITPKGYSIVFTGYRCYTQIPEVIAYLDQCIADGVPGITIEPDCEADEITAEGSMRKKFYAEFLAEQEALKSPDRDMGTTPGAIKTGALTSKQVAN
jgi:hypothetical protein